MTLQESCELIRKEFVLNTEYDKAVAILLEFCESVLKAKGMPNEIVEYTDNPGGRGGYSHTKDGKRWYDLEWNQGYNQGRADMLAYHSKIMDKKRIRKIIDYYNDEVDGSKMSWEEYRNQFAAAIVAELEGGK